LNIDHTTDILAFAVTAYKGLSMPSQSVVKTSRKRELIKTHTSARKQAISFNKSDSPLALCSKPGVSMNMSF
jgi:hypothetical protein